VVWAPDYCTSAELKSYLRIGDNADDVFIALWITTASRNVDDFCSRQFGQTAPEVRTYTASWDRHLTAYVADIDDVMEVDTLSVTDPDGNLLTDYELVPDNALLKGKPYERIITAVGGKLTLSAPWGWTPASAGPTVAKMGLLLQANRLAKRRDSAFGISGSPQEQGEVRLLAQLDVDFKTSLKPFQRNWWAA
jgi:hypothetical protein